MKIQVDKTSVTFVREDCDPKFYGIHEAKGESNLFYWLVKQFANGHPDLPSVFPTDWIKKRMWKDGHMVSEMQQYLRTHKPTGKTDEGTPLYLCIYNGSWAIRGAEEEWNEGSVTLVMETATICSRELSHNKAIRSLRWS